MSAHGSGGLCRAARGKGTVSGSRLFLQSSGCGARRGGPAGLLGTPAGPRGAQGPGAGAGGPSAATGAPGRTLRVSSISSAGLN